jgi:Flp pilus assembly protein TadB
VIAAVIVGATAGLGLLAGAWALVPPRTDLAAAVGRFDTQRTRARAGSDHRAGGWRERLGRRLAALAANHGWTMPTLRANLALLDRTLEAHLVAKVLTGAVGLLLPAVVVTVLAAAGIRTGWTVPVLAAVLLAVGFSFLPDLSVTQAAETRRAELRRALACYLGLVAMSLAGGRGVPEALPSAARIGRGWAFELIADTLACARYSGITAWQALTELGDRVDVPEVRDLGHALSLVSDDGAKIKESLMARAGTARARQLAAAEGEAQRASESIRNAHLLLGFGFLLFLGFPAVAAVLAV